MPAEPLDSVGNPRPPARRPAAHPTDQIRAGTPQVEVRRSTRRRRTVSAYREDGRTIVLLPARMSAAEEQRWIALMLAKLAAQEERRLLGDDDLVERAARLSERYLEGRARPSSVRWVTNQHTRWGSCTPAEGSIRLSHRVQGMPEYVVDYVLLHELAHLLVPGHGADFWRLLHAYPRTERARGFLEGVVTADRLPHAPASAGAEGEEAEAAEAAEPDRGPYGSREGQPDHPTRPDRERP